jgi:hypothetical protein
MGLAAGDGDGRSVEELAGVFTSKRSKVAALLELLGLAYSDTDFEPGEASLIAEVARRMNLTAGDLAEINGWVQEHVGHIRRALVMMRE